jgi:hypothetical protein
MSSVAQVQEEAAPAGRPAVAKVLEFWLRVRNHVWRAVYLLGVLAFLLPFATVKGCGSGEVTDYRGFELITKEFTNAGWVFLLPICVGLAFFGLSFVRRRRYGQILLGFLKGWRAVFASIAAFAVLFFPFITFLFDEVRPRIGYFLGGTCWSLVYLGSLVGAFIHLWKVGRSRASPAGGRSWGIVLLRVMHYLLAGYVIVHPLVYLVAVGDASWIPAGLVMLSAVVSLSLVLHFAAEGIGARERWALVWGAFLSFCLLVGCIVVCAYAIKDKALIKLMMGAAIACFAAVVFAGSLSTLRTFGRARASE